MSDKRKDLVVNIPRPRTVHQLRQFLGVVNYFRDHISDHSIKDHRLRQMASDNKLNKRSIIKWTKDLEDDFNTLKQNVLDAPKLYYLEDQNPQKILTLETDASDYGIGTVLIYINMS